MEKQEVIFQLKFAIQALSLDAEEQVGCFPDFVDAPDELLTDFDHWYTIAISEFPEYFSNPQLQSLKTMDVMTAQIPSGVDYETTLAELKRSPYWKQMRKLAKQTLKSFGWSSERPPLERK